MRPCRTKIESRTGENARAQVGARVARQGSRKNSRKCWDIQRKPRRFGVDIGQNIQKILTETCAKVSNRLVQRLRTSANELPYSVWKTSPQGGKMREQGMP